MKRRRPVRKTRSRMFRDSIGADRGGVVELAALLAAHPEVSPALSGGDLDADWCAAYAGGDEAVGGTAATPDQDVVDEIGEALGLGQRSDAQVRTSAEILGERDRHRWWMEDGETSLRRRRR